MSLAAGVEVSRLRDGDDYPEVVAEWERALRRANDLEMGSTTRPLLEAALGRPLVEPYDPPANRVAFLADLEDHPDD
jgi:hypothetical protein